MRLLFHLITTSLIGNFTSFQNLKPFCLWLPHFRNYSIFSPVTHSFQHTISFILPSFGNVLIVYLFVPEHLFDKTFLIHRSPTILLNLINAFNSNQARWLLHSSSMASKAEIVQPRGESRASYFTSESIISKLKRKMEPRSSHDFFFLRDALSIWESDFLKKKFLPM